jgi:hypothetical protein
LHAYIAAAAAVAAAAAAAATVGAGDDGGSICCRPSGGRDIEHRRLCELRVERREVVQNRQIILFDEINPDVKHDGARL